jgi:sarcosine oxidase
MLYTIPDFGDGFKAGLHHTGPEVDPYEEREPPSERERALVAEAVRQRAPAGAGAPRASVPCFYTSTPDQHFAIGPLPSAPNVILAAACSGHGFKFATAIGEAVAGMAMGERSALMASRFEVERRALGALG